MSALGDLGEILAAMVLIGLPLAVSAVVLAKNGRERAKAFHAFASEMAVRGFVLRPGSSITSWSARGDVAGVPVAIEPFTSRSGSGKRARTESLTAVRVEVPTTLGRVGLYAMAHVPLTELGAMRELSLPPELAAKYRAFAERSDAGALWGTPEARSLLLDVGDPRSIESTSGALVLLLEGLPASAPRLLRAAELQSSRAVIS